MNKYIGAVLLLAFLSCNNANQKVKDKEDGTDQVQADIKPVELADPKLQAIFNDYITLKNALVDTKYKEAAEASKVLAAKLASHEGCENTALIANKIASAANIQIQRKEFTYLSSDVIALYKHSDLKKGEIYVQHCPMANNGDGGDWLSSDKNIRNPYYGAEMMECGGVLETLQAGK